MNRATYAKGVLWIAAHDEWEDETDYVEGATSPAVRLLAALYESNAYNVAVDVVQRRGEAVENGESLT